MHRSTIMLSVAFVETSPFHPLRSCSWILSSNRLQPPLTKPWLLTPLSRSTHANLINNLLFHICWQTCLFLTQGKTARH